MVPTEDRLASFCFSMISLTIGVVLLRARCGRRSSGSCGGQRAVGRNRHHVELVDLRELLRFGIGRAGHAGELLVHAEVVLEGDGGQRLVLALDLDPFLGLHRLVQAVAPAAARHQPAGELVDDDDLRRP